MTFEAVERLAAGKAAMQRLAGRRAETADFLRMRRTATRAFRFAQSGLGGASWRRRDAKGAKLLATFVADPVGRPGGRQYRFDLHLPKTRFVERIADRGPYRVRGGTASVGRRNRQLGWRAPAHLPHDPEIDDG